MNLSGLGRNGDVLRWLQMVLQQSQSPRGQVPVARPLGVGDTDSAQVVAPDNKPEAPYVPTGHPGRMEPAPNPFDVARKRRTF